jgi:hypothetical protein
LVLAVPSNKLFIKILISTGIHEISTVFSSCICIFTRKEGEKNEMEEITKMCRW